MRTWAEGRLWLALRRRRIFKFRRQHRIERYVVDFYCARVRLAVELDGAIHDTDEARQRDAVRTAVLRALGIRMLRFRNEEVTRNVRDVVAKIEEACCYLL
jgi:very-short-patch-repair endonuclease